MSRTSIDEFRVMLERLRQGRRLALATVVATAGSVYRRAGARMLIEAGGDTLGSVSGGCLEADLQERALRFAADPRAQVITYDGLADDGMPWGLGLGCNGRVTVVLQCLASADAAWAAQLCAARQRRAAAALATVFDGAALPAGVAGLLDEQGAMWIADPAAAGGGIDTPLRAALAATLAQRQTRIVHGMLGADCRVLLEYLPPPIHLCLVGGGDDAVPLVAAAVAQGWAVSVCDHRPALLQAACSAGAAPRAGEPEAALAGAPIDTRTAVVVMTHHYERDRRALAALATRSPAYLGVLGPRARTQRIIEELRAAGVSLEALRSALHAPVGLALGAETAAEIAVAIIAEIIAHFRGGAGGALKDRDAPIHAAG
ncbi:MAG: XdhC family protein [Gammaproteobacteria bacterium]|nr:XdhC family protein [Gammaproteobacteria bacterium]